MTTASTTAAVSVTDLVAISGVTGPRRVYRGRASGEPVIVKIMDDGSITPAERALTWLAPQLSAGSVLSVPRVIDADHATQTLVTTELSGIALADLLGTPHAAAAVRRVGYALAELHSLDPGVLPITTIDDHIRDIADPHPDVLAIEVPSAALIVARALDLLACASAIPRAALRPIHRDFHVRQIIIGEQVGVVDWDLAAAGDPLFDAATFMTYLETHRIDPSGGLRAAFLDAYTQAVSFPVDGRRLAIYRLFNLLRRACRRHRLRDRGWPHGWVAERDRMLSEVGEAVEALR